MLTRRRRTLSKGRQAKNKSIGGAWLFTSICLCQLAGVVCSGQVIAERIEFDPVTREVIEARLKRVSTKEAERIANLRRIFEEAGCEGERLAEQRVKGSRWPNLVCSLPGETDSMIVVGAHFDYAGPGKGVADNWSGASLLPSLYESLRNRPRRHTFVFVGFTDEEKGLRGSAFFAKQLASEQQKKARAMVNLDTLGLSSTKVWIGRANPKLAIALGRVANITNLPLQGVNIEKVGSTDSESFSKHKIPSITIHSLTQETLRIVHSPWDNPSAVRLDYYYDTYRLVAAYLAFLDANLEE